MQKKSTIIIVLIILLGLLGGLGYANRSWFRDQWDAWHKPNVPTPVTRTNAIVNANEPVSNDNINRANTNKANFNTNVAPKPVPAEYNLDVPFTTQAPLVNWDHAHDEACEEAAALIVDAYWNDKSLTDKAAVDAKLLAIEDWEVQRFGYYESTTVEETAIMLREYFNLNNVQIVEDPTVEQLKRFISEGKPVMVPAAGRQLGNPNFRSPGPVYHFLVLKGYTEDTFITNDPGTRKGADYIYSTDTIMTAMHDWNGGDVDNGRKAVIVVNQGLLPD